jgi:SagB-type dehydrogenase family enzyme
MNLDCEFQPFPDPSPREKERPFEPYRFAFKARRLLQPPLDTASEGCLQVMHQRQSRRVFGALSEQQLSALLWFSAKTLRAKRELSGFSSQHRPAPSGGGRHPVHILLLTPASDELAVTVYEPEGHALLVLDQPEPAMTSIFAKGLQAVLPPQSGTVLWLAAEHTRTSSRYLHCESLVWRDAGALLATIHLAAEALSLNCCAYGVVGGAWITRLFPRAPFVGVGGCVVGSRLPTP